MATFGLVHGAGHGAWCWERLIPILEALGHRAFAMDLPCEDPTAGRERYAEVVDRALPPASDLVLVGHSLAGLTVPLVARAVRCGGSSYCARWFPSSSEAWRTRLRPTPSSYHPVLRSHPGRVTDPDGAVRVRDEAAARDVFCQDCPPPRTSPGCLRGCGPRLPRPGVSRALCRPGPRARGRTSSAGRTGPSHPPGRAASRASAWVSSRSSSTGATHPSSPGPRSWPGCSIALRVDPRASR